MTLPSAVLIAVCGIERQYESERTEEEKETHLAAHHVRSVAEHRNAHEGVSVVVILDGRRALSVVRIRHRLSLRPLLHSHQWLRKRLSRSRDESVAVLASRKLVVDGAKLELHAVEREREKGQSGRGGK